MVTKTFGCRHPNFGPSWQISGVLALLPLALALPLTQVHKLEGASKLEGAFSNGTQVTKLAGEDAAAPPPPPAPMDKSPVMEEAQLKARIDVIKSQSKEGGMEPEEYFDFQNALNHMGPMKLLVFGLGYDSVTINELNRGGETHFLESDVKWASEVPELKDIGYEEVNYKTSLKNVPGFLTQPFGVDSKTMTDTKCWDVVLIDSPPGRLPEQPGRMQAFHSTAVMAEQCLASGEKKIIHVWTHDNNRPVENLLSKAYFGLYLSSEVGPKKLRHFELKPGFKVDSNVLTAASAEPAAHQEEVATQLDLLAKNGNGHHDY